MGAGGASANAEMNAEIGLVEPKRGDETVHIEGYTLYRSDRWDYEQSVDGRDVKRKHGGALLLVAD